MRIGVMIGPERGRFATKVDRLRADARWAEDAGLASIWTPQIPDEFDALTAATVMGVETERIEIGTAVVPLQDVLGLGSEARMNTPGVATGNWVWRFREDQLGDEPRQRLAELTALYGRWQGISDAPVQPPAQRCVEVDVEKP